MDKLLMIPMSGEEMLEYNPDAELLTYLDIANADDIDELFNHNNKIILLYIMEKLENGGLGGHWTCLYRDRHNNHIHFFDSYGLDIDAEEKYVPLSNKNLFKENYKYLTELLDNSNYNILHSKYKLQGKNTQTCGRFVSLRLLNKDLDDDEFFNIFF